MMKMRPPISLTLGSPAAALDELQIEHLVLDCQINTIPSATVTLAMDGKSRSAFLSSPEVRACQPGERITVQIEDRMAFSGMVTGSRLVLGRIPTLELTLHHPLIALDSQIRSQVFKKQTDREVLQALCEPCGGAQVDAGMTARFEQRVQYQCSDWQMTRYLLDQNGVWLLPLTEGIRITAPKVAARADHVLSGDAGACGEQTPLYAAECQFSALNHPATLKMTSWNIQEQALQSISATKTVLGDGLLGGAQAKTLKEPAWEIHHSTSPEASVLKARADSLLMNLNLSRVQGKFTVPGSLTYQPGQTLAVRDFGQVLDGSGLITGVRHILTRSEWKTELRVGRSGGLSPIVSTGIPAGQHPGVVMQFENDELKLGRFPVSLPLLGLGKENVLWARFAVPYASKNSGFICYPEPGDEVVVSFFDGQPDSPVITGAMYNPKNTAPVPADEGNAVKGLIINSSLQLTVNKQDQQILLKTGADDKGILLDTGKEQATLHEGITLAAKSTVTVKGNSIALKKP